MTNETGLKQIQMDVEKIKNINVTGDNSINASVTNEILKTTTLTSKQNNVYNDTANPKYLPILTKIINPITGKTYIDFKTKTSNNEPGLLPGKPYYLNTFSKQEISNMLLNTSKNFSDILAKIEEYTIPKPDPKIPNYKPTEIPNYTPV